MTMYTEVYFFPGHSVYFACIYVRRKVRIAGRSGTSCVRPRPAGLCCAPADCSDEVWMRLSLGGGYN